MVEWKCLQPDKLAIVSQAATAEDEWKFSHKVFTNFVDAMHGNIDGINKLNILTSYLIAPVNRLKSEKLNDDTISALKKFCVQSKT